MIDKLIKTFGLLGFSVLIVCSLIHILFLLGFITSGFEWKYVKPLLNIDVFSGTAMLFFYLAER
jgi:hypothetical protein